MDDIILLSQVSKQSKQKSKKNDIYLIYSDIYTNFITLSICTLIHYILQLYMPKETKCIQRRANTNRNYSIN